MFLVPNDTVNHFSLGAPCGSTVWEHRVLQVRVPLDRALSVVLLTLLTAQSLSTALAPAPPDSEHLTCLSIPCWSQRGWCLCFLVRPPRLHLGAGLLIVSKNFSPETHTASPFPPEFYLHCKWQRNVTGFVYIFCFCFSLYLSMQPRLAFEVKSPSLSLPSLGSWTASHTQLFLTLISSKLCVFTFFFCFILFPVYIFFSSVLCVNVILIKELEYRANKKLK